MTLWPTGGRAIEIRIVSTELAVTGVSANDRIAVVGLVCSANDATQRVSVISETLSDGDGDGRAVLALGGASGDVSVWLAVSGGSGEFALHGGQVGFPRPFGRAPRFGTSTAGAGDHVIAEGHSTLQLLLFRPGGGVWRQTLVDGGESDESDVVDGEVVLTNRNWDSMIGPAASPGNLRPTDVLFAIDPATLEVGGWRIGDLDESR